MTNSAIHDQSLKYRIYLIAFFQLGSPLMLTFNSSLL